jgi:hypothetical protein
MPATRVTCPRCSAPLPARQTLATGRPTLCPACRISGGAEAVRSAPAPDWLLAASSPAPAAEATAPASRPEDLRLVPAAPARRTAFLLSLPAGVILLLCGSTALALRFASGKDEPQQASIPAPVVESVPSPQPVSPPIPAPATPAPLPVDKEDAPPPVDVKPPAPPPAPPAPPRPPLRVEGPPEPPPAPEPVAAPVGPRPWLPRGMQLDVNRAIDRGVTFLKPQQKLTGSWEERYALGYAALPALTLLECGVAPDDPRVQKAAAWVRRHARVYTGVAHTYELSLALLFLDRLGEERDKALLGSIAMRLVAGQHPDGGWTYGLPELTTYEEESLRKFLTRTRPRNLDRFVRLPDGRRLDPALIRQPGKDPLERIIDPPGGDGKPGRIREGQAPGASQGGTIRQDQAPQASAPVAPERRTPSPSSPPPRNGEGSPKKGAEAARPAEEGKALTEEEARKLARSLPPRLLRIPAVAEVISPEKIKLTPGKLRPDNSNTQFATLALWAALRHGLPVERSVDALARRFRRTQHDDGHWEYIPGKPTGPAMTGAGLLGLAVGHGLSDTREKIKDAQVGRGFRALAEAVGKPLGGDLNARLARGPRFGPPRVVARSPINLYLLWTVERVGVLYDARTIDGKDWYRWGVELLLEAQRKDGSWQTGKLYPGSCRTLDTCLALLFLKRANFTRDLTRKLELIIDPGGSSLSGR